MAYYPATDTKIVSAKTEAAMKTAVANAMAEGYYPVDDNSVWDAKLVSPTVAYRQAMVKLQNTDPQFIAAMFEAFRPTLEGISNQLSALNTKLDATNTSLSDIDNQVSSINTKLNTANTLLTNIETNTR